MNKNHYFKFNENIFYIIVFLGLVFSILNSFYQIKNFDNYNHSTKLSDHHSMINGDINNFWSEGHQIVKQLKNGKNYFETGGQYKIPYLPSRIFALFSITFGENLNLENGKVSTQNKKIIILIFQSFIYYLLLLFLYKKIIEYLPLLVSKITVLFLAFEPTIFMYHSSFWSESIFFSIQLVIILFVLKKKHNIISLLLFGVTLGIFYMQRSVAIFYIIPIMIFFYLNHKKNFIKFSLLSLFGFLVVLMFLGYHNFIRSGIFYVVSTQAKEGFYIYLAPDILATKKNIEVEEAVKQLDKKKEEWVIQEDVNLNKEEDRMKYYNYKKKIAITMMFEDPITSLKVIANRTMHFFVIDPVTHVYYFHSWNNDNGYFYRSEEHRKWILPRILYSFIIYFFCFFGTIKIYKEKKYRIILFYIFLSIFYFTAVQSWFGSTRYFAPILIYLAFLFSFGIEFFIKKFRKPI